LRKSSDIFRHKLAELIANTNSNPTRFAREAGFYPAQVRNWLDGENIPGLDALDQIARFFGVPAASLISEGPIPEVITKEPTDDEILARITTALKAAKQSEHTSINEEEKELLRVFSALDKDERARHLGLMRITADPLSRDKAETGEKSKKSG